MPLVLLSLHIYFYQTTSYSQSAAGSFHGSLEKKKPNSVNICPIELQIQSEKGHTDLIFPVCNEQWWSRHQNSRISSFYFFFRASWERYIFILAWKHWKCCSAFPAQIEIWFGVCMDEWMVSVCASRGFCCSDDLIAVCPPPVLSQQKALLWSWFPVCHNTVSICLKH